jgi:hypothetical protein
MNPNIYNPGFTYPMAPIAPIDPIAPIAPIAPMAPYFPANMNTSFKMGFVQPSNVGQIVTPRHRGNFPHGFNGQINFYDPLTGRQGPTVNTFPQVQTMINRPNGLNVNIVGNPSDVSKVNRLIAESNNVSDDDFDDEYVEFTEDNLKKLKTKIISSKNKKRNLPINLNDDDDDDGEYIGLTDENLKRLSEKIISSRNKKRNLVINLDDDAGEYIPLTDENLKKLSAEIKELSGGQNAIQNNQTGGRKVCKDIVGGQIFVQQQNFIPNVFPNSEWKLIGDLLVHSSLTTTYSGSGVLLFDRFVQNNVELLTVIMAQEQNGEFGDFGGMISTFQPNSIENSLAENAKNKIAEESCGSLFIQSNIYNFYKAEVVHDKNKSLYRCYLIGVDGDIKECANNDLTDILNSNRRIYKKSGQLTSNMQNLKSIARFDLRFVLKSVNNANQKVTVVDTDGNPRILTSRVVKVLQHLRNNTRAYGSIFTEMLQSKLTSNNGLNTIVIN